MEKILLALDARKTEMDVMNFAIYLAKLTNSKLTGVFLENVQHEKRKALSQSAADQHGSWDIDDPEIASPKSLVEKNIQLFKAICEQHFIKFNIHRDRGVPVEEIVKESRFADLIIVDSTTSFEEEMESRPTSFVKDILQNAECPVIIAPKTFKEIDELVFTYDGSRSAAFAIKQFTYLFPHYDDRKVMILQVNKEGEWSGNDKYNLKEWLQNRYSAIGFETLKGSPGDVLFDYLFRKKNVFVVMGAYGRNNLSQLFKPSRADTLIKKIAHPIFISHY